jgi:hypothetical protein
VRSFVIRTLLPYGFCLVPLLAAGLVMAAIPPDARNFYLKHLTTLDCFILSLGVLLFVIQIILGRFALRWETTSFNETFDRSLSNLAQSAEWFPLLGLIGTVAGIMQTFASFGGTEVVTQSQIIAKYAPAITATMSGLFMALLNILPTWVVLTGRQIILKLGGELTTIPTNPERKPGEAETRPTTTAQPNTLGGGQGAIHDAGS